jgi:hypothetical protein
MAGAEDKVAGLMTLPPGFADAYDQAVADQDMPSQKPQRSSALAMAGWLAQIGFFFGLLTIPGIIHRPPSLWDHVVAWFYGSSCAIGMAALFAWPVGFALIRDQARRQRFNGVLLPYQIIGILSVVMALREGGLPFHG